MFIIYYNNNIYSNVRNMLYYVLYNIFTITLRYILLNL